VRSTSYDTWLNVRISQRWIIKRSENCTILVLSLKHKLMATAEEILFQTLKKEKENEIFTSFIYE
jgi:hypothetical protein